MTTSRPENSRRLKIIKTRMRRRVEAVVMLLLGIISLAHLARLLTRAELLVDGIAIPLWVSLLGCAGPALLAGLLWWTRPEHDA